MSAACSRIPRLRIERCCPLSHGFERGQRAFHIVDPAERREHIERLAHAGVDVEEALGAGQLQVETWDSVYLRGGRFDPAATVNRILNALTEVASLASRSLE